MRLNLSCVATTSANSSDPKTRHHISEALVCLQSQKSRTINGYCLNAYLISQVWALLKITLVPDLLDRVVDSPIVILRVMLVNLIFIPLMHNFRLFVIRNRVTAWST